jgi:hypothetical protein
VKGKKKMCANNNSNTAPKKDNDSNSAKRPQVNNGHVDAEVQETETHAQSGTDTSESKMLPKSLVKESEYDNLSEDAKRKASAKGQLHRSGLKVNLEEKDVKEYQNRSYDDLSSEFQRMYPSSSANTSYV